MDIDPQEWEALARGLEAGDEQAARRFWQHYGPVIGAVVERSLSEALRRRVGPEDVVQSVCRTFFRRARAGELVLDDAERLRLLVSAIAVRKVRSQARFHGRKRRALERERTLDDPDAGLWLASETPSPESVAMGEELWSCLENLGPELREVVLLKVADFTNEEIAARLGCSERTVRRSIGRARDELARQLVT